MMPGESERAYRPFWLDLHVVRNARLPLDRLLPEKFGKADQALEPLLMQRSPCVGLLAIVGICSCLTSRCT